MTSFSMSSDAKEYSEGSPVVQGDNGKASVPRGRAQSDGGSIMMTRQGVAVAHVGNSTSIRADSRIIVRSRDEMEMVEKGQTPPHHS